MENKEYTLPEESEDINQINEPALEYTTTDERFEKDWQRAITLDEFKERLLNQLEVMHG